MDRTANDQIRAAYDTVAQSYAKLLPDSSFEADLDIAMVEEFVRLLPGPRVLDVGCGAGRMMTHLISLDETVDVAGVDLSAEMVRQARAVHPDRDVVQGDMSGLPHASGTFDGVLGWYSIIHTPPEDLLDAAAEFCRVLRPGGVVLLAFQTGAGRRTIELAYGHEVTIPAHLHTTDDVADVMRRAGLEPIARLDRAARPVDKLPQGFVLGRRTVA